MCLIRLTRLGRATVRRVAFEDNDPHAVRAWIAVKIRELADLRRLTLVRLAEEANVSRTHLWAVLGGRRSPTSDVLTRLANVLRVNPHELLRPPRKPRAPK
ncbi:MAG: helix-turn-helix transcriptional regulator [Nannocystaceae bacterium]